MFHTILIANRGEIACRVAATAKAMGIRTVAVYSDADADSKHVAVCDVAVRLGPAPAKDSYLRMDAIVAAAKATGAQAIHPGYGFLSENEDFSALCEKEGLVFIGPPPNAISAMGLKAEAKQRMEKAGVPLVPGYHGADQTPSLLEREAARIGYPVLIKASAGGGGKGMRVVQAPGEFAAALESCKREASNSFGDDAVLVEKYLTRPRHIEVQVFADRHGTCLSLFERDCSVQRRHQKVLEEAPAPGMTAARRKAMGDAAVAAAKAVGYVGAGTVEFIAEGDAFYFMEMNTRLQVEHPVTEAIIGHDLVAWQLKVAAGERLPVSQDDLRISGHALEARLYAENAEKGFLPSTGMLTHLAFPPHVAFTRGAVRVDSGVRQGDAITPFYDPMVAKLIVWGEDRPQALRRMAEALKQTRVVGLTSNVAFLTRLVESPAFANADLDTGLIAKNEAVLFPPAGAPSREDFALAVAGLLTHEQSTVSADPWSLSEGWRLNGDSQRSLRLGGSAVAISYTRAGLLLNGESFSFSGPASELAVRIGGMTVRGAAMVEATVVHVFVAGRQVRLERVDPFAAGAGDDANHGNLVAPMPGKVVALLVKPGSSVSKGTPLLVMEAMKMEHTLSAPADGVVKELSYGPGEQVAEGAQLIVFERSTVA
jgi:3-methylcrotonyl-CoA carboxylase alpha subunit